MKDELTGLTEEEVSGTGSISKQKKYLLNLKTIIIIFKNSSCSYTHV